MDGKTLCRLAAIGFVAGALTATAIEMTREEDVPAAVPAVTPADDTGPLRTELPRCQQLGEAATRDQFCLRPWADNRRRILGIDAPDADRAAVTPPVPATEARSSDARHTRHRTDHDSTSWRDRRDQYAKILLDYITISK